MRFRKIRWSSWWWLGELCEIARCLLWRGQRHHCPMYNICCNPYFVKWMSLFFLLHGWIPSGQISYMNYVTPKRGCESPNLQHDCICRGSTKMGVFKEVIKLNEVVGWDPNSMGLVSLQEEEETRGVHEHRGMAMWGHSRKAAICKPRREASEKSTLPTFWSWTSSLQNCQKINPCCLKLRAGGRVGRSECRRQGRKQEN